MAFDRDMEGCPEEGMDEVVISAPLQVRKGRLWFDGIITSAFEDVRYHTPDWQAPFINEGTDIHWLVLNKSWNLRLDVPQQPLETSDIEDIELVTERFVSLVTPSVVEMETFASVLSERKAKRALLSLVGINPKHERRYGGLFRIGILFQIWYDSGY